MSPVKVRVRRPSRDCDLEPREVMLLVGLDADEGVAADVLAAFDGFEEEGLGFGEPSGAGDAEEGGDGGLEVGGEGAVDGHEGVRAGEARGSRAGRGMMWRVRAFA